MLRSISIAGLGPHASTTLSLATTPSTSLEISGRSEAGKSLLLDAVCWALWGVGRDGARLPDALVRASGEAEVTATTLGGRSFQRRRKLGSSGDAIAIAAEGTGFVRCASQEVLGDHLKALADAQLGRLILVPFAWRDLAEGPGSGRDLRAFLDRVLPGPTAAQLLADELLPGEPVDAKRAEADRREARKAADKAAGALGEAQRSLAAETGPPAEPDPGKVAEAREELARHEEACRAFQAVIDAAGPWRRAWNAFNTRNDQIARRTARAAALHAPDGPRPTGAEIAAAEKAADDAAAEESDARAAVTVARSALRRLQESIDRMRADLGNLAEDRARAAADPCKGLKAGACQIASRAAEAVAKIDARAADLTGAMDVAFGDLPAAQEVANAAEARNTAAMAASPAARAEQRRLAALDRSWTAYDRDLAALGPELEPLPDPGPEPTAPTPGHLLPGVRELVAAAGSYPARLADHAARLERLQARVAEAQTAVDAATVRADRAETVLALVRSAPGRALAGKLSTLTDLGPVSVELTDDAIDVQIDGRPWRLASTGRQIVADATFRAALRRAVGRPWIPIVIDEVQSVGGQPLPALPAVWLIRTTDGDLAVRVLA